MLLGFMQKFPWGELTNFDLKILLPHFVYDNLKKQLLEKVHPKIHTIREGQRWKAGDWLHMATGVRTKHYNQFNKNIPELSKVKSVQRIDIFFRPQPVPILHTYPTAALVAIDRKKMYLRRPGADGKVYEEGLQWFTEFVKNDGLTEEQFWKLFKKPLRNGQLIHWTDLKY